MPLTRIGDNLILDQGISRDDLNTTTPDKAVITKVQPGFAIELMSSGVDEGTGDVVVGFDPEQLDIHDAGVISHVIADMFTTVGLQITIPTLEMGFYKNELFEGPVVVRTVPGTTLTVPNNQVSYVYASYNNDSPFFGITTDVSIITESATVPVNTLIATNGFIHLAHWNNVANGLANKLHRRFVKTQRYAIESGLSISVNAGVVEISPGVVWRGVRAFDLQSVFSDGRLDHQWFFLYKTGGVWQIQNSAPSFNYTQYQGTNDLVNGTGNKYVINWVFRGVEDHEHGYYLLGGEYTSYATAVNETKVPALPPLLSTHAVLVGRIICQYGNAVPVLVESYRPSDFLASAVSDHNQLANIQGGDTTDRYHLTETEHTFLAHIAAQKVGRDDVNTTNAGHAVIAKAVAGTSIALGSTGVDAGTGDVTINWNGTNSALDAITAATQAIAQNVNTKVIFGTVRTDLNTEWSAVNNRFVAKQAGVYNVSSIITTTQSFNNSIFYASIYKNGVEYTRGIRHQNYNGWSVLANGLISLAVNDYIEIYVTFGAARTIAAGIGSNLSISRA